MVKGLRGRQRGGGGRRRCSGSVPAGGDPVPYVGLLIALSAKRGSELITLDQNQSEVSEILKSKGVAVSFLGNQRPAD